MLNIRVAAGVVSRRKYRFEVCGGVHYLSDFGKAVSGTWVFPSTMTSTDPEVWDLCYTVCSDAEIAASVLLHFRCLSHWIKCIKSVGYSVWLACIFSLILLYGMIYCHETFFLIWLLLECNLAVAVQHRTRAFLKCCLLMPTNNKLQVISKRLWQVMQYVTWHLCKAGSCNILWRDSSLTVQCLIFLIHPIMYSERSR